MNRPESTRTQNNIQNVSLNYAQYLEQNRIQHPGNAIPQQQFIQRPVINQQIPQQVVVQQMPRQVVVQQMPRQVAAQQMPRQVVAQPMRNVYQDDDVSSVYSATSYADSVYSRSSYAESSNYSSIMESSVPDSAGEMEEEGGELKSILKEWLTLDSKIKDAGAALRKLRKRKEALQEEIVKFMEENGLDELKTPNDDISLKEQTSTRYVTSKVLLGMLSQLSVEKNIPILRNFLATTPLQFSKTKTKVQREEHVNEDSLDI